MLIIELNINAILGKAMQNESAGEMVKTYQVLDNRLKAAGINLKRHILDNKCSKNPKQAIEVNVMGCQPVPLADHMRNITEKTIQTFEHNFVVVLCRTGGKFPM